MSERKLGSMRLSDGIPYMARAFLQTLRKIFSTPDYIKRLARRAYLESRLHRAAQPPDSWPS